MTQSHLKSEGFQLSVVVDTDKFLFSEKYSHLLLRRLTSPLPTFSKTMDRPPSTVLDLGCGQGHWLLDAANFWPNTDFTGFDLVDVMLPEVRERGNVRLLRGNL